MAVICDWVKFDAHVTVLCDVKCIVSIYIKLKDYIIFKVLNDLNSSVFTDFLIVDSQRLTLKLWPQL